MDVHHLAFLSGDDHRGIDVTRAVALFLFIFYFLLYINNSEEGVIGKILKFADDTYKKKRKLEINKNYKMTLIN